ncbi:MAG: VanW family protein [Pyrinomonadaceae bacterium]
MTQQPQQETEIPSKTRALIFRGKAALLQLRRGWQNSFDRQINSFSVNHELKYQPIIGESKTALWTENNRAEQFLLAGKIQNLRVAVQKLNGAEIPAGATFSFWAQIGKTTRRKGYVAGRELREGCIIPNIGGWLCQLSNALYDAALQANLEIIERHAHTQIIPGSLAEMNRDATVFWNYVDLRFKSENAFRIEANLSANHLTVRFKARESKIHQITPITAIQNPKSKIQNPNSCMTCGVGDCFRSLKQSENLEFGRTTFLVDEFTPEFDLYLQENRQSNDLLFVPLDGKRFKKPNYAWTRAGFAKLKQSWLTTLVRSYKSRRLAAQGAQRQRNLLLMAEKLAVSYAKKLPFDATHLVVQQNLLPFLWRDGHLGGRTFDVLMTALPIKTLQEQLDYAASLHPESPTLGDFRAENQLLENETEALKNARKIITSHTEIAALFVDKSILLDWKMPPPKVFEKKQSEKFTIVFPASTVGRKGVYELREALSALPEEIKLIILGAELEGSGFWRGFDVEHGSNDWLQRADLVVLPAFVEHKPRRLLLAAASGVSVIASKACGLENVHGITSIKSGDVEWLRREIEKARFKRKPFAAHGHEIVKTQ